jgi:rhodanese-related sulfurtransferase
VTDSLESLEFGYARLEVEKGMAAAVDVRSLEEWDAGHIPGAIHLADGALHTVNGNLGPRGSRLIIFAKDGLTSARAAARLGDMGYDAVAVNGGWSQS